MKPQRCARRRQSGGREALRSQLRWVMIRCAFVSENTASKPESLKAFLLLLLLLLFR